MGPRLAILFTEKGDRHMGYEVKIETVMQLAKTNYEIAERYAEVTRKIARTDDARGHLVDQFGESTAADKDVMAMLDEFEGYLKTTTARYYLVGEQLVAAAEAYVQREGEQQGVFDGYAGTYEKWGVGDYGLKWDPDEVAKDTDRPDGATDDQAEGFSTDENPAKDDEEGKEYLEELEDEVEKDEEGD